MSAALHVIAQWGAGCAVLVGGSLVLTLVISFFVSPEMKEARQTVGFLLFLGGLLAATTWGAWDVGRRLFP